MAPESAFTDKARLKKLKAELDKLAPTKKDRVGRDVEELDLPGWFSKIENAFEEGREKFEENLKDQMDIILDGQAPL